MKSIAPAAGILLLLALSSSAYPKNWVHKDRVLYTVVSTSEIRPNSVYTVVATVEKASSPTNFLFTITHGANQIIVSSEETIKEQEQTAIFLKIPDLRPQWGNYKLKVKMFPKGDFPMEKSAPLTCSYVETTTIIQTDKPIYKPNDLIQYRVLLLDRKFRPLDTSRNISIVIRDPDRNIIHAIFNEPIPAKRGFISDNIKLSSEPKTGEWKIQTYISEGPHSFSSPAPSFTATFEAPKHQTPAPNYTESVKFHVQKYEPSKVKLNLEISPSFVTQESPVVTAKITPMYNSWQPLYGQCKFTLKQLNSEREDEKIESVRVEEGSYFPVYVKFNPKSDLYLESYQTANAQLLAITASCTEPATNRSYEETIDFKMFKYPYQIQLISNREYLKPKMKNTVRIRITSPHDNKPISDAGEIQVQCVTRYATNGCQSTEIIRQNPSEGEFLYTFLVKDSDQPERYISLIVTYKELNQTFDLKLSPKSYFEKYLATSVNQNLSSISIRKEGKEACLEISSTFNVTGLSIVGLSNGNLVYNNFLTLKDLEICGYSIPIKLLRRVAPSMTFVAYTVNTIDEFIVSDVSQFYVQQTSRVGVDLTLSTLKSQPGNNITISLKGVSNSTIGLRAVQKTVLEDNEIDYDDDFSETRLISAASRFKGKRVISDPEFKGDNTENDMMSSGLILISNVKRGREIENRQREEDERKKSHSKERSNQPAAESDESFTCKGLGWIKWSWFCVEPKNPQGKPQKQEESESNEADDAPETESPANPPQQKRRSKNNFPETWIWEEVEASEDGLVTLEKSAPPSINSWTFSAFQINQGGIGFSRNPPLSLQVTTPFFLSMDLPYSIVVGEHLTIQVFLYNNQNASSSFNVTLQKESGTKTNFLNDPHANQISETITVLPFSFSKITFVISALEVGTEKMKVTALQKSDHNKITIILKPLTIKPRGRRYEKTNSILIDLRNSRNFSEKIIAEFPVQRIPGGDSIRVNILGDVSENLMDNLEKLMSLPNGCGEQNMVKFASSIIILEYLDATGTSKSRSDLYALAIENLRTGYQNQLNFLRSDGSFSSWGDSDPHGSSTWLTADVLQSFIKATKYITIDEKIISRSLQYLANQQKKRGSFTENNREKGRNARQQVIPNRNPISLTAFVLLAFKAAQDNKISTFPGGKSISEIIDEAKEYLTEYVEESGTNFTPYQTALVAYVLSELNDSVSTTFLNELEQIGHTNKTSSLKHWNAFKSREQSRQHAQIKQFSVETTGYALMAFIKNGQLSNSFDIARWLLNQINSNEEYVSPQDAVIGISALVKFLKAQKINNSSIEMHVDILHNNDNENKNTKPLYTIHIGQNNRKTIQEFILLNTGQESLLRASGKGIALSQITWSYTVDQRDLTENDFTISVTPTLEQPGTILRLLVCAAVSRGTEANKAIIEMTSPSGFEFDHIKLDLLKDQEKEQSIEKWELFDNNSRAVLYLHSLHESRTCFSLLAFRTNLVTNLAGGFAKVYDYYDRTRRAETIYPVSRNIQQQRRA